MFGMISGADIFMRDNRSFIVSEAIEKQKDGGGFDHA
jgi:hypothetical protein